MNLSVTQMNNHWLVFTGVLSYYMVPGIMGVILTMTMVMITSMAIVREREYGAMEQLIVTPMKSWEVMLGKISIMKFQKKVA